ncbi:tRNA pseudouridine(13) synthase TruD [Shewanella maritima]|uniref:tRNA pseudouridine(13) synthase TruD n=1 Tax=Shewanella maritima TaxID=2520507 RepID=UPI0037352043
MDQLHYLHGKPDVTANIRTVNEDFIVQEILPFAPTGEGEHHLVHIRKSGLNTAQVVDMLAKFAKVHPKDVGYAGQKDKNAVTEQWFGIRIPGKDTPDWKALNQDNLQVLECHRHSKKLRIGALIGNRFTLTLKQVSDIEALLERLNIIKAQGVPNYFGEQRFGHHGKNLIQGRKMLNGGRKIKDRKKRSLYLSAVRSNAFNIAASARLAESQQQPLDGDCVMLSGSKSFFVVDTWDEENLSRLASHDIQLSAPLWGRGDALSHKDALASEQEALSTLADDLVSLEQAGLNQERRPIILMPQAVKHSINGDSVVIEFFLPAGSFATSILRELVDYQDVQNQQWLESLKQETK